jgi:hypothetical protein
MGMMKDKVETETVARKRQAKAGLFCVTEWMIN